MNKYTQLLREKNRKLKAVVVMLVICCIVFGGSAISWKQKAEKINVYYSTGTVIRQYKDGIDARISATDEDVFIKGVSGKKDNDIVYCVSMDNKEWKEVSQWQD